MSKVLIAFSLVVLLAVYGVAAGGTKSHIVKQQGVQKVADETCPVCIDFMVAAINYYLNLWLQVTMPNTCAQLCGIVDPAHNNTCTLYCEIYGVYGFIQVLSQTDIDPIYMCQLQKQCPVQPCATSTCAKIDDLHVKPDGQGGYTVTGIYTVTGPAGAGMLRLMSSTPADGGWTEGPTDYLVSSYNPGQYKAIYSIEGDLNPGTWTSTFYVCLGECESVWPNSQLFAKSSVTFVVPPSIKKN